jgi:hypothetical protein
MGGVGLTRDEARTGVQGLLDAWPYLANAAANWRAERTTDDYYYNDMLSFVAIFPYGPDQDPSTVPTSGWPGSCANAPGRTARTSTPTRSG